MIGGAGTMQEGPLTDLPAGTDRAAILERLSRVLDPELDESILGLGFVRSLALRHGHATVTLQLPTSWCAINFAFIMAEDVRAALLAADGIDQVTVLVGDHSSAREIEAAVNRGEPFAAAFPGEAGAGLAALRTLFLRKGFLLRQERLLRDLRAEGLTAEAIGGLCVGAATTMNSLARSGTDALERYLERRAELALDCAPTAPLIVDQSGTAVPAERMETWYQHIRTVRVSLEANGSFCRAMLATRRASTTPIPTTTNQGDADVPA
jgi:metal-sulfur cluster biosynthetic enzyme